mmetsp:Transcript_4259/g.8676  ORF Transcript_4259/g.8676 Transcript_4259/m.8676 type:complete len:261 (-) Transcript_4259:1240-2022(-)
MHGQVRSIVSQMCHTNRPSAHIFRGCQQLCHPQNLGFNLFGRICARTIGASQSTAAALNKSHQGSACSWTRTQHSLGRFHHHVIARRPNDGALSHEISRRRWRASLWLSRRVHGNGCCRGALVRAVFHHNKTIFFCRCLERRWRLFAAAVHNFHCVKRGRVPRPRLPRSVHCCQLYRTRATHGGTRNQRLKGTIGRDASNSGGWHSILTERHAVLRIHLSRWRRRRDLLLLFLLLLQLLRRIILCRRGWWCRLLILGNTS